MALNIAETVENILNELRRLQGMELQISEALRKHGLTLVKTAAGYDAVKLGEITAQPQKKSPERSDQPEVLGGIHSIARNHSAGLVVTVSFKTSEDAVAFEQYALSVANKKSPGQSDQIPKNIRVYGWVWKDKLTEDDCYIPSYTPAQHVPKGELLALVDPADLHQPLENTKWF